MTDENQPISTTTEKLVAYLDGELPESASHEMDQTLVSDPVVRVELEKLNRAWELLDLLPRPNVSGEFSSRTITAMQAIANEDAQSTTRALPVADAHNRKVWQQVTLFAACLLLITFLGFSIGRRVAPKPDDSLLHDLALIEQLELYSEIGDVQFLKDLQAKGLLDDPPRPPERR